MTFRGFGLLFLLATLSVLGTPASAADDLGSEWGDRTARVHAESHGAAVFNVPKVEGVAEVFIYSYAPACAADTDTINASACAALNSRCNAEPGGQMVVWERRDTRNAGAGWQRLEQACLYPGKPPERPGDVVIAVTEKQLRELPIKAPELASQPGRHTLKGAETNVYAHPADQTFSIDIVGKKVDIKVRPAEYRWNYGDGTTLVTGFPGGPIPEARWGEKTVTSHIFTQTADVSIGLTTVFTGTFSVDGGPYQPIAGTAQVPSAPKTLSIWRSEVKLYADNCITNPTGPGCS